MPNDPKQELYKLLSAKFNMPSQDAFNKSLESPETRSQTYELLSKMYKMPDYNDWESQITMGNPNQNKKELNFFEKAILMFNLFTPNISQDTKSVMAHLGAGPEYGVKSIDPESKIILNQMLASQEEWDRGGKRKLRTTGIPNINVQDQGAEFLKGGIKLQDPSKAEKEYEDNLHKLFKQSHDLKVDVKEKYVKSGLIDPNNVGFWDEQAFSIGMNLPYMVIGGAGAKFGLTAISTGAQMMGIPAFTLMEANSHAGDMYGFDVKKDSSGRIVGKGNLKEAKESLPFGLLAGSLEFWGVSQAVGLVGKLAKNSLKELGWKYVGKELAKVSAIEGGEEVVQDAIEQSDMIMQKFQKEFDFKQTGQAFIGGAVGGLLMGGMSIGSSFSELKGLKSYAERLIPKLDKMEQEGIITKDKADSYRKIAKDVVNAPLEELQPAIENVNKAMKEANREVNAVAGTKAFPIAYDKTINLSEKFYTALSNPNTSFSDALSEITSDTQDQEIYKQRIRKTDEYKNIFKQLIKEVKPLAGMSGLTDEQQTVLEDKAYKTFAMHKPTKMGNIFMEKFFNDEIIIAHEELSRKLELDDERTKTKEKDIKETSPVQKRVEENILTQNPVEDKGEKIPVESTQVAAVVNPVETNPEVLAIEKKRQEELKNLYKSEENPNGNVINPVDEGFTNIRDQIINNKLLQPAEKKAAQKLAIKLFDIGKSQKEVIKLLEDKYIISIKYKESPADKINAKYDAELAKIKSNPEAVKSTGPTSIADIQFEDGWFQEEATGGDFNYENIIASTESTPEFKDAKELINHLETNDNHDKAIKPIVDWMLSKINPELRIVDSNTIVKDKKSGNSFKFEDSRGAVAIEDGKWVVYLNKTAKGLDNKSPYRTLAHELFHILTVPELSTNREFRANISDLVTELRGTLENTDFYYNNKDRIDRVLGSNEEFLAHIIANTFPELSQWMQETSIPDKPKTTFMQWLKNIFKNLISKKFGKEHKATLYDSLEVMLSRHIGYPDTFKRFIDAIQIKEEDMIQEDLVDRLDKPFTIVEKDSEDPRIIKYAVEMLAGTDEVSDYIAYMQTQDLETVTDELRNNEEWIKKAKFHYDEYYKKEFDSLDEYTDAIVRQMYNYAKSLRNVPVVRINKTITYQERGPAFTNVEFEELGSKYLDKNGRTVYSYKEDVKLFEALPLLEDLFKVKFDVHYIDEMRTETISTDKKSTVKWEKISEIDIQDKNGKNVKNASVTNQFEMRNHLYLGTWSDKKSLYSLQMYAENEDGTKTPVDINDDMFKSIREIYEQKIKEFALQYVLQIDKAKGNQVLDIYSNEKNTDSLPNVISSVFGENEKAKELVQYLVEEKTTASQVVRMVLEDIRLGGRIVNGQLQTALFNINRSDTFDAIKMYKRPNLVSPKRFVDQQIDYIQKTLDSAKMQQNGMFIKNGKLQSTAFIFNSEMRPNETLFKYRDKEYDIAKILTDTFANETTDGKIMYVLGGFDDIWRKMHGAIKKGAIKAWIGNKLNSSEFNLPFYVKGAYHGINENEILAQWMKANNITLLISSSAAKVNSYQNSNLFDESPQTFTIPFDEIHRDLEKGGVKDGAKGLQQTILANFITPENKGFVDDNWNNAIESLVQALSNRFKDSMNGINAESIVQFAKEKALTASSEYEKVLSELIIDLTYTSADKEYQDASDAVKKAENPTKAEKDLLRKKLEFFKTKNIIITQQVAEKIANVFHEPYFSKIVKDWVKRELETLTDFKTPSTWAVLDSDMGYLTQKRYELIEQYIRDEHSIAQYKDKLPKLHKERKRLLANIEGLTDELSRLNKGFESAESDKSKSKIAANIESVQKELDQANNDYEALPLDDDGKIDRSKIEITKLEDDIFQKRLAEIVDPETGKMRQGYTMITKDIADYYKIQAGDSIIHVAVPSDSLLSANGSKVVGIMDETLSESGKIILNSEYIQGIVGKDYDIDTMLIIPMSDMFEEKQYADIISSLQKSLEKHKQLMLNTYREKLGGYYFEVKDPVKGMKKIQGRNLEFKDILTKEVRLAYTQLANGVSEGRKLFNPFTEGFKILNEYTKDIGKIVNRRKLLTLKSQIGFSTFIKNSDGDKVPINPNHKGSWENYLLLLNLTNDMVDMPTNTNKFFYYYNKIKAYDQDNGSSFFDYFATSDKAGKQNISTLIDVINSVENFLFSYGTRLTTDYNLDNYGDKRELEDNLKYIVVQQELNMLMDSKNKTKDEYDADKRKLLEMYLKNNMFRKKDLHPLQIRIAGQYILNMNIDNTSKSPIMNLINQFDINSIPAIEMSREDYEKTWTDSTISLLNSSGWADIKTAVWNAYERYKKYHWNASIKRGVRPGSYLINKEQNFTNNDLVLALHLLTTDNMNLHYLKTKIISLMNPMAQKLSNPKLEMGTYVEDIYQKANEDVYPIIIRKMFESNKSFLKNTTEKNAGIFEIDLSSTIGDVKFALEDGILNVYYKSNKQVKKIHKFSSSEIAAGINNHAKALRTAIYGEMFKDPNNRIKISSLIFMGGMNLPISDRLEEAAKILKKELLTYSKDDRIKFWTSLLGQATDNMRFPLNLVLPYKNKVGQFNSQDPLLNLITLVKDPIAKTILRDFYAEFDKKYTGPEFYESMKIKERLDSPDIFNSDNQSQIWFEESIQRQAALDKIEYENPTQLSAFLNVNDIGRSDDQFTVPPTAIVGETVNLATGEHKPFGALEVTKVASAFETNIQGKISMPLVVLTKAIGFGNGINEILTREMTRDNLIGQYYENIKKFVETDKTKTVAQHITDVTRMIENNPLKIEIFTNPVTGEYNYLMKNSSYLEKDLDKLFEDAKVPVGIERTKHKIAFEFHKRYSLDHIDQLKNMMDHLIYTSSKLPKGFNKRAEIDRMIKKYDKLIKQFQGKAFHYTPRVYKKDVWERIWKKESRQEVTNHVMEMIKKEQKAKAKGLKTIGNYADLVTQAEIDDQIEKELAEQFGLLKINSYGDYVHSFEMKREIKDPLGEYIKDSFEPHQRHLKQFTQMLTNDLYYTEWLQYEYNAAHLDTKPETIKRMKRWFKMVSGHRALKTDVIEYNKIKVDDEIEFFALKRQSEGIYEEQQIRGKVVSVSNDRVFLEMNRREMQKAIEGRIQRLREETIFNMARNLSQRYELENLRDDGYLKSIPKTQTMQEAQDMIIEGYFNKLEDRKNWGSFRFDQIYTKQFKGTDIERKAGVRKSTLTRKKNAEGKALTNKEDVYEFLNTISSAILLGGPQAGVRNYIDANWALQRDLRLVMEFFKDSAKHKSLKKGYKRVAGDPASFIEGFNTFINNPKDFNIYSTITKVLNDANKKLKIPSAVDDHMEILNSIVTKVALESGLGKSKEFGNLVANEANDVNTVSDLQKFTKSYAKPSQEWLMQWFSGNETNNRLKAAYLYGYKAIYVDKLTDINQIENVILKGIARTQSLYESIYRRLGEDSRAGALLFKFVQYNAYQLETYKQGYEQAKRIGLKFSDIFRRNAKVTHADGTVTIHRAGDSIDPNIAHRLAVDLWYDSIGVTLGILMPGFRASNPLNSLAIRALLAVAIGVTRGETPDEWDLRDWLFSIMSFWTGLGITLPIQMLGYVSGKFGTPIPLITTGGDDPIFPVAPKVGQTAYDIMTLALNPLQKDEIDYMNPWKSQQKQQNTEWYLTGKLEKMMLGFNVLVPTKRSYYSDEVQDFQSKSIYGKANKLLFDGYLGPLPNAEFFIPVLNAAKYK